MHSERCMSGSEGGHGKPTMATSHGAHGRPTQVKSWTYEAQLGEWCPIFSRPTDDSSTAARGTVLVTDQNVAGPFSRRRYHRSSDLRLSSVAVLNTVPERPLQGFSRETERSALDISPTRSR